jgi:hypothetical protein
VIEVRTRHHYAAEKVVRRVLSPVEEECCEAWVRGYSTQE